MFIRWQARKSLDENCIIVIAKYGTVPTFNFYTKCVGRSGIIHDRMPDCQPVFWPWMTSQLNVVLIRKLRRSLMCLTSFWHVINVFLYNQALADVRATGAGSNCVYCRLYGSWTCWKIHGMLNILKSSPRTPQIFSCVSLEFHFIGPKSMSIKISLSN